MPQWKKDLLEKKKARATAAGSDDELSLAGLPPWKQELLQRKKNQAAKREYAPDFSLPTAHGGVEYFISGQSIVVKTVGFPKGFISFTTIHNRAIVWFPVVAYPFIQSKVFHLPGFFFSGRAPAVRWSAELVHIWEEKFWYWKLIMMDFSSRTSASNCGTLLMYIQTAIHCPRSDFSFYLPKRRQAGIKFDLMDTSATNKGWYYSLILGYAMRDFSAIHSRFSLQRTFICVKMKKMMFLVAA